MLTKANINVQKLGNETDAQCAKADGLHTYKWNMTMLNLQFPLILHLLSITGPLSSTYPISTYPYTHHPSSSPPLNCESLHHTVQSWARLLHMQPEFGDKGDDEVENALHIFIKFIHHPELGWVPTQHNLFPISLYPPSIFITTSQL